MLVHAIPLTLIGLGVAFALRAGLFNIGGDGQFIAGTVVSVFFAPYFGGLGLLGLLAFLDLRLRWRGRAWRLRRLFARTLQRQRNHRHDHVELRCGADGELSHPRTDGRPDAVLAAVLRDPAGLRSSRIVPGTRLHAGLIVALVMVIVFAIVQRQTVLGFQSSVLGANPGAAIYAGFRVKALTVVVMAISGGLGGFGRRRRGRRTVSADRRQYGRGFRPRGHRGCADRPSRTNRHTVRGLSVRDLFRGAGALQRELALPFPLVWIVEATVIFAVAALHWALPTERRRPDGPVLVTEHPCRGNTARHGDRAAAIGESASERSGIFNIGIEGIMLSAAFVAAWGSVRTGSPWLGIVFAMVIGLLLASFHALMVLVLGVNQFISGIGMVIFGFGFSSFAARLTIGAKPTSIPGLPADRSRRAVRTFPIGPDFLRSESARLYCPCARARDRLGDQSHGVRSGNPRMWRERRSRTHARLPVKARRTACILSAAYRRARRRLFVGRAGTRVCGRHGGGARLSCRRLCDAWPQASADRISRLPLGFGLAEATQIRLQTLYPDFRRISFW